MIQEFSVQNFLSFREKQTISFVATKDKTHIDELTVEVKPGFRLLRMAMIYGANASGKSNLLQAVQALWALLFTPNKEEHKQMNFYLPFALCKGEPIKFEVKFWTNSRRYEYELEYNEDEVLYEKMQYTSDSDVLSLMYERKKEQGIKWGTTLTMKAKERDMLVSETFSNHTLLSTFNKKNIDIPLLKEVYEWIKVHVHELGIYNDGLEIAEQASKSPALKQFILELLNKADLSISDFELIEVDVPKTIKDAILKNDSLSETTKHELLISRKQVLFTHLTESELFPVSFGMESAGTRAYFRLARLLYDLKNEGCVCMEDELEDSLHYDLLIHFLQIFLHTESCSQLIFTTHNQLLLSEDWLLRRDMVWLTEKDKRGETILYSAAGLGLHKNLSLLNAYRIGKMGAKPLLGSTYLNTK